MNLEHKCFLFRTTERGGPVAGGRPVLVAAVARDGHCGRSHRSHGSCDRGGAGDAAHRKGRRADQDKGTRLPANWRSLQLWQGKHLGTLRQRNHYIFTSYPYRQFIPQQSSFPKFLFKSPK